MSRDARRILRCVGLLAAVGALLVPALAAAKQSQSHDEPQNTQFNAVYSSTNDPTGNAIIAYARHSDGTIVKRYTVSTGGIGIASEPPFGFPIIDTSGSINLTPDGRLLFVVNAGDNTVSSFSSDADAVRLHVLRHRAPADLERRRGRYPLRDTA